VNGAVHAHAFGSAAVRGLAARVGAWAGPAPLVPALALWAVAIHGLDLDAMTDLGLVSILPPAFFAALGLIVIGFVAALFASRVREGVLAAHTVALVLVVHGTPSIVYGTLRYSWAWKHVGIVDYIQRNGRVDPDISFLAAYHNWPGFFALAALPTELGGWTDAIPLATWAPVAFELLFVAGMLLLAKALTPDVRLAWLATWFFLAANWIGQDYFAPQALSFFLYLVVVGLALRYFGVRPPAVASPPATRVGVALLLVLAIAFVASTHQLTPFMLALALTALVVFRRIELRLLPLVASVLAVAWVVYMAVGFLESNLYWVVDSIGSPEGNASATLINLGEASAGMREIALVDRALTAFVALLAVAGAVRRLRNGHLDAAAWTLGAAPFLMIVANAYGSEMLFRVYFFALPAFAFLAAGAVLPVQRARPSRLAPFAAAGISALLVGGLCVAYYGKERLNYFPRDEVHASRLLYATAERGALLVSGTYDYPWAFDRYERFHYVALSRQPAPVRRAAIVDPVRTLERLVGRSGARYAYFIVTRTQRAEVDMTGVMPRGTLAAIERKVARSPEFHPLLRTRDASVFRFVPETAP
jgi:hypothetical protein